MLVYKHCGTVFFKERFRRSLWIFTQRSVPKMD